MRVPCTVQDGAEQVRGAHVKQLITLRIRCPSALSYCSLWCRHATLEAAHLVSGRPSQATSADAWLSRAQEYSTLWRSLYSMFAAAVGEFDSKTYLQHHNPGVTLPLFVVYLFIVAIILLNLLVALLTNSFQGVRALLCFSNVKLYPASAHEM